MGGLPSKMSEMYYAGQRWIIADNKRIAQPQKPLEKPLLLKWDPKNPIREKQLEYKATG